MFLRTFLKVKFVINFYTMKIPTIQRHYVHQNQKLEQFGDIEPLFQELLTRTTNNLESYQKWLEDISELEAFIEENGAWRYIKM